MAGPLSGGTTVAITGTGFSGASGVSFGSVGASAYTGGSPTQLTATSPPEPADLVDISVTTPSGTSATSAVTSSATKPSRPSVVSARCRPLSAAPPYRHRTGFSGPAPSASLTSATTYTVRGHPAERHLTGRTVTSPSPPRRHQRHQRRHQFSYERAVVSALSPPPPARHAPCQRHRTAFGASAVEFGSVAPAPTPCSRRRSAPPPSTHSTSPSPPRGTSATSAADEFTYEAVPTVSALSPWPAARRARRGHHRTALAGQRRRVRSAPASPTASSPPPS